MLKVPKAMQQIFDAAAAIIGDFCVKHLNEEYSLWFPVNWLRRFVECGHHFY